MTMDEEILNPNAPDLYAIIRNKYNKITMVDVDNNDTVDETEAVQFDIHEGAQVITLSLADIKCLKVYYNKDILSHMDQAKWEDLLGDLRSFTSLKNIRFDLQPVDRPLNDKDREKLSVMAKNEIAEGFSKWDGSSRSSWQGLTKVKVKVRHKKAVDENIQGARARNVARVFIETNEGERWKFPFPLLDGARAMARHIEEGGSWNDRTGQHILDISEKIMTIRKFGRQARKSGVTENAVPVLVRLGEKLDEYKKKLHLMQGARGYHSYKGTMAETYVEPVEHFAGMFAKVDEDLVALMPSIEKILGEHENTNVVTESVSTFVKWLDTK